tara:strand:+ start:20 stop:349 length:330 start_codon:yes stop_codon:yes gene_type:complete
MYKFLNYVNRKWNNTVFLFHDIATKTRVGWLVKLSIWAHDRMFWELPEKMQLIDGVPVSELRLQRELELANHQIKYWVDYATELQTSLFEITEEIEKSKEENLVPVTTD